MSVYHYEIIGGDTVAKFMLSDNGTLCISSQIHIKVTYVIPGNIAIHLSETKKWQCRNASQKAGEKKGGGGGRGEKMWNLASLEKW